MKKSRLLILVVLLSWLSLSSVVINNASAVKWFLKEKTVELDPEEIGKLSVKDNDDHTLEFMVVIISNFTGDVSIIMFLGDLWPDHKTDIEYLYCRTIMEPIENLTKGTYTFSYHFTDNQKYYPAFINWDEDNDVIVQVSVTKEEISVNAYYFGGIVTVIFVGTLFWLYKKKESLTETLATDIPAEEES